MPFTKATKTKARLRLALIGPSGSGKTYSALSVAKGFGGKLALIDTEHGSASKYADLFDFDTQELSSFSPEAYIAAIDEAAKAGYDVLVIDSLSHAWMGKDGILESVDKVTKASRSKNTFTEGWRDATPRHNALVEALVQAPLHLIVTMRAKTEYVMQENAKTGKSEPTRVGMAAIQRDGVEYEFDVVGDMTLDLDLHVSKSRCPDLTGAVIHKPDASLALTLEAWLTDGAEPVPLPKPGDRPELGWPEADEVAWRKTYTERARNLRDEVKADFKADAEASGLVWKEAIPKKVADDVDKLIAEYQKLPAKDATSPASAPQRGETAPQDPEPPQVNENQGALV